jgi:hypothetical protein
VMAQAAKPAPYHLKIRYVAPAGDQENKLLVNYTLIDGPRSDDPGRYDKSITFPKAGQWTELDVGIVNLKEGDNYLKLYSKTGGIEVDYFKLEPVLPAG